MRPDRGTGVSLLPMLSVPLLLIVLVLLHEFRDSVFLKISQVCDLHVCVFVRIHTHNIASDVVRTCVDAALDQHQQMPRYLDKRMHAHLCKRMPQLTLNIHVQFVAAAWPCIPSYGSFVQPASLAVPAAQAQHRALARLQSLPGWQPVFGKQVRAHAETWAQTRLQSIAWVVVLSH
jgi:hypothetical protein